ncbi:unnamed protein product [Didymodactylos carnosus]|uniref:Uncharacterized protein n=1 Tax=Didymodactylos carnosus TaxID=1234261 RepID=A0A815F5D5_9BILA|nr:unnamed protein product [Didymodactylos carnosus]CAF1320548.1 unnamed protein product [Didymodactylos carnosus]CAF4107701.1 unnamed protein product [Didymodactylos carnosus]CAF4165799.1 unnamed protein product [Didymodactylos carnosus]
MAIKESENKVNADVDRKRAVKENKEGIPGGKVPQRVDKASNKKYEQRLLSQSPASSSPIAATLTTSATITSRPVLIPVTNLSLTSIMSTPQPLSKITLLPHHNSPSLPQTFRFVTVNKNPALSRTAATPPTVVVFETQ